MLTLRRTPTPRAVSNAAANTEAGPSLTLFQMAVLESHHRVVRVLGGPGTGKSTVAVEVVAAHALGHGSRADRCLLLAPTRLSAARLRDAVTARVSATSTQALARTWQSFAFAVLRTEAALLGEPAPRLLSGPEQDAVIKELLAGHASGDAPGPQWPERLTEALGTRGLRNELRDLFMRAAEHGVGPDELRALGAEHERPEWVAAADVLAEYVAVTALAEHNAYDPAYVLTATADLLEDDPEAFARVAAAVQLVVVDDAQEMTAPAARLLGVLARTGARIVLLGDPDAAVETFRGADPTFLATGWQQLAPDEAREALVLPESFRLPEPVARAAREVVRRIGALGGGEQRAAHPAPGAGSVELAVLRSPAQEAGLVASELRRAHLVDGLDWSQMAVIVRGSARAASLRRLLAQDGVPVSAVSDEVPLRDEPAVAPLVTLLSEVVRRAQDPAAPEPSADMVADLLTSAIGGADALGLRRLRRELRREELEAGGTRTSDELLVDLLRHPVKAQLAGPVARPAARLAMALEAGELAAARSDDGSGWAPGVTGETVLWAIWQGLGLAESWRRTALAAGPGSARADRDLDAVLALFDAAAGFVDRLPAAGPDAFLEQLTGQDVRGDSLLAGAQAGSRVEILTPQSAAGRDWQFVCVAGVQEGVWPDLRLRGSVLGSEALVDAVHRRPSDARAAHAAVRYDETRLFHVALTRSRGRVLVTAVASDVEQPSVYFDVLDPLPDGVPVRPFTEVHRPMTLTGLVAELRRALVSGRPRDRERAARLLAVAAAEGVTGSDPSTWWALRELSVEQPVRAPDQPVEVSPSRLARFQDCPLSWFLGSVGGQGTPLTSATLGTVVHGIVAEYPDAPAAQLHEVLASRWHLLGLGPGWVTERTRGEAADMIERYVDYRSAARAQGWRLEGVEQDFRAELGRAIVAGQVDRIERDAAGRLVIVDFKTGASKPTAAEVEHHPQLGAYQAAVESGALGEGGSGGAALVQLGRGASSAGSPTAAVQSQGPVAEAADPQWAARMVAEAAEGMGAASFPATQNTSCRICALRSCCPAQPEGRPL